MNCRLCSCQKITKDKLITTDCQHTFHVSCLEKKWTENSDLNLSCPICEKVLGGVYIDDNDNHYVGINTKSEWISYYTIIENRVINIKKHFPKWKRNNNKRLQKHESINMLTNIIVS
jgi:hypothetical protein